ncbi:glycerol kinase GlpK [Winogradskyella alexanderae]|uniref:Glycerol kinase n=1 Tax=Winogradskyella alexanderae TaxID=2877123 RepID=A0ABS7XUB6_9FLAO|nr:glycerol kinase GlpK [Winogradskyella alexanderae]MCA0132502.1 glycerol kinase GlpK [Winogradskyella alexanderae]
MSKKVILALDQGTTSSRTIAYNSEGKPIETSQQDFEQIFPKNGWVEHNPKAIWESQLKTIESVLSKNIDVEDVAGIGITNQRETTIVWNRDTGEPIHNAIVWQDRRTASYCDELKAKGHEEMIQEKTGLIIDAYFSATKLRWLLKNVEGAMELAKEGKLCFGTVDTWLIYKLTDGDVFVTDVSNASRTMLFNIRTLKWDRKLLELFDIPKDILPEVKSSSEIYGYTRLFGAEIPIAGIAGDQQAALFGQLCTKKGMAKNTYGTGCFLLMNTGKKPVLSQNQLLTTIAWQINGKTYYALEGSVFVGGAAVQWLRDGINLIDHAKEIEALASSVPNSDNVIVVPAFTGLGAPYWDPYARGSIMGISRGTKKGHIARATLEGIALQVYDIVKAMENDSNMKIKELRVDGGASANNLLLQIQSDIFECDVIRPTNLETTALGAAYLAGLAVGMFKNKKELKKHWEKDAIFEPNTNKEGQLKLIKQWHKAVKRSKNWLED